MLTVLFCIGRELVLALDALEGLFTHYACGCHRSDFHYAERNAA